MKLCRCGSKGAEKPGAIDADGRIRDRSGVIDVADVPGLGRAGALRGRRRFTPTARFAYHPHMHRTNDPG